MQETLVKSLRCLNPGVVNLLHKNQQLNQLIKTELTKEILRDIQINEKESNEIIINFRKGLNLNDDNKFSEWLAKSPFSEKDIYDTALYKKRFSIFCDINFPHKVESHFLERKKDLDLVVYSLIRISNYYKAKELFYRVYENEEDFGELAKKHSEGIEKKTRGIVGPIPVEKSHPKLNNLLRTSKTGEIQQPVQIDEHFVIIRVENFESAKLDKSMREKMNEELFNEWINSQVNELSSKLIEQSNQTIEDSQHEH